jgi:MerR family transcriptional regulator, light-induced transcriptional regulator
MDSDTTQIVETERWIGLNQDGPSSHPAFRRTDTDWLSTRDVPRSARRSKLLASVVEAEILPRLTRLHPGAPVSQLTTTEDDTQTLVRLLLGEDDTRSAGFVDSLRQHGATPAALYLGVITQAARVLGVLWAEDRCDFVQVTLSMGRLQRILRTLSEPFQLDAVHKAVAETVLLVPGPGEQHTFGLLMVSEFFRREGWRVAGGPATSAHDAVALVRQRWVDVAGFSIGSLSLLDGLARCIQAVRRASRNRHLAVMVGGSLFQDRPSLLARTGADATANDAVAAVRQASGLLGIQAAAD